MTSSLVGSEMCIRDRPCPAFPGCGSLSLLSTSRQRSGAVSTSKQGTKPVSYTHLTLPTICSV
eukprot:11350756-Prorocentrum_lima.AAC.1